MNVFFQYYFPNFLLITIVRHSLFVYLSVVNLRIRKCYIIKPFDTHSVFLSVPVSFRWTTIACIDSNSYCWNYVGFWSHLLHRHCFLWPTEGLKLSISFKKIPQTRSWKPYSFHYEVLTNTYIITEDSLKRNER